MAVPELLNMQNDLDWNCVDLQAPISLPVRTNQIPRQVPAQPWYITGDGHSDPRACSVEIQTTRYKEATKRQQRDRKSIKTSA